MPLLYWESYSPLFASCSMSFTGKESKRDDPLLFVTFLLFRIVKLTSPNLNYFIILGAIFLFASIYIRVYFDSSRLYNFIRCNVSSKVGIILLLISVIIIVVQLQAIMNCVGYVLLVAPVLAKMWRIHYIFHNPLPNKKVY